MKHTLIPNALSNASASKNSFLAISSIGPCKVVSPSTPTELFRRREVNQTIPIKLLQDNRTLGLCSCLQKRMLIPNSSMSHIIILWCHKKPNKYNKRCNMLLVSHVTHVQLSSLYFTISIARQTLTSIQH